MERRVFDAPFDESLRQVVADALLEAGDARGEFIALQLEAARRALTPDEFDRMIELERTHGAAWNTFPEAQVEYARGFPWLVRTSVFDERPAWGTVGVLVLQPTSREPEDRFLRTCPFLHSLERVINVTSAMLPSVASWRTPQLRAIDLADGLEPQDAEALAKRSTLETLAFGCATLDEVDWLWSTPLARQLSTVRLRLPFGAAPHPMQRLRSSPPTCHVTLECWLGFSLEVAGTGPLVLRARRAEQLEDFRQLVEPQLEATVPGVFDTFRVDLTDEPGADVSLGFLEHHRVR
ncbi:MAG: hypothetical protein MUC96_32285 [Myxococcaceae bacterium]|nr:hypothetical protein [Myxococcaceae bacterium]